MIAENVKNIQERITDACIAAARSPDSVTLIAVSKTFGYDGIVEVTHAGVLDIGENYVQEVTAKKEQISDSRIRWHFIGHLQSNKVKYIADWIHLIHSIDSDNVAMEVEKRGASLGRTVGVLVEVNTSGEATKFGVRPNEAAELIRRIGAHPHLNVQGLMTIGPFSTDLEQSRQSFRLLKSIFDTVNAMGILRQPMVHLSMGMSHDFQAAIAEGSTMVRIGTAIFGSRTKPNVQ
jgi:hypothetical protein